MRLNGSGPRRVNPCSGMFLRDRQMEDSGSDE